MIPCCRREIINTPITISEEEEIDVCQAVDEMIEDGRKIRRRDGKSHERYSCFDGNVVHWVIREAVQM